MTIQMGRESPKILTLLAPCFLREGTWGVSASEFYPLGLCCFYHADPNMSTPTSLEATGHCGACKEATVPCQYEATAVYHHGFSRWDCYSFRFVAGTAYAKCACSYPYLSAWRKQGRAPATHVVLSVLCVHHPK